MWRVIHVALASDEDRVRVSCPACNATIWLQADREMIEEEEGYRTVWGRCDKCSAPIEVLMEDAGYEEAVKYVPRKEKDVVSAEPKN